MQRKRVNCFMHKKIRLNINNSNFIKVFDFSFVSQELEYLNT